MRRIVFISLAIAFCMMISVANEGKALEKVVVGYAGVSSDLAHLWIAKEAGFFVKYGLAVEPVLFRSGTELTQSLISGEINLAESSMVPIMRAILAGGDLITIAGYMNKLPYTFYVAKDITLPEQLKGKAVACSAYGTTSHASVILALRALGLRPGKDVTILQIGDQSARFSGLEANSVQGVTVAPPLTLLLKAKGFNPLVDLSKTDIAWVQEGIAANRLYLKRNPEVVKNFMKGFIEGLKLWHTDRAKTIELLAKFMKLDMQKDKEALEDGYEHMMSITEKKPYPSLAGIKTQLELIAEDTPKAKGARPEQFLDLSILQELDKSGFIDGLYK